MTDTNPQFPIATLMADTPLALQPGADYTFQAGGVIWLDLTYRGQFGAAKRTYRLNNNQIVRLSGDVVAQVVLESSATQGVCTYFTGAGEVTYFPTAPDLPLDTNVAAANFVANVAAATASTTTGEMGTAPSYPIRVFFTLVCVGPVTTAADVPYIQIVDKTSGEVLAMVIAGGALSGSIDYINPGARIAIVYANPDTIAHQMSATYYVGTSSASQ